MLQYKGLVNSVYTFHKIWKNTSMFNINRIFCSTKNNYEVDLRIENISLTNYLKSIEKEYKLLSTTNNYTSKERLVELQPVVKVLDSRKQLVENIKNLDELLNEKDEDIRKLAEEEKVLFEDKIKSMDEELLLTLLPVDKDDSCDSIVLEINAGVGGQEAMLFAKELFDMYCNFIEYKGWNSQIAEYVITDLGGIRHASILVDGQGAFHFFKYEAGVHRVQRTPTTEKAGRIHTSTVSVLALPQPTDIDINIEAKDLKIETKRASGAGGQHVNTTDSAVRIVHIPSGLSVECQVDRSQIKNRQIAMIRLKAMLYQKELDSQIAESEATRKSQVRSNNRNEKIRTYNYNQDRITDHRLQSSNIHNLKGFLVGGEPLENLINKLDYNCRLQNLINLVNSTNSK